MIRWVALRGALLFVDLLAPNDEAWSALAARMGITYTWSTATSEMVAGVNTGLSPDLAVGAVGLASSIRVRWMNYAELEHASVRDVNASPWWRINDAVALDYIAWASAAVLRSGQDAVQQLLDIPEPSRLDQTGWYIDPLFAKCERYWDGHDWTPRARALEGRRYAEFSSPLH